MTSILMHASSIWLPRNKSGARRSVARWPRDGQPRGGIYLRGHSTRATITPTSFVNHYEWGDFKGDEDAWMNRFFDAFLYTANWGTNILKLRVPSERLSLASARAFHAGDTVVARQKLGNTIITLTSNDETGDWDGDHPTLASMISIRNELARGDLRALYLGGEVEGRRSAPRLVLGRSHPRSSLSEPVGTAQLVRSCPGHSMSGKNPDTLMGAIARKPNLGAVLPPIARKPNLGAELPRDDASAGERRRAP